MKLNIFEGARRIALLFGGLWTIGCLAFALLAQPYWRLHYSIAWPGRTPVVVEDCPSDSVREYVDRGTTEGATLSLVLCFPPQRANDWSMLIPYTALEDGTYMLSERYSPNVTKYVKAATDSFELPGGAADAARVKKTDAHLEQWKNALMFLFGGWVAGAFLVSAIGWIARGFMGIPRGLDAAPEPRTP